MFLVQIQFYNQNTFEKDVNQGENSEKKFSSKKISYKIIGNYFLTFLERFSLTVFVFWETQLLS
jgi:hypothetical protein